MVKPPYTMQDADRAVRRLLNEWRDRGNSGLAGDAKIAGEKIEKMLDESGLTNEQKREALKRAAKELGIPLSMKGEGVLSFPIGDRQGTISFTNDKIPSVTDGKSPAMDFMHALQSGNPEATRVVDDLMSGEAGSSFLVQGPRAKEQSLADTLMASTYNWAKYFNFNAKQEKKVQPMINHYRQALRSAHRFQLDNDFTQYATEISNNTKPEKLLYRLQFATLPYETTWIEFNLHVKVRTMRAFHGLQGVPEGVAQRMGVLLRRIDETCATVEMVGEKIADDITAPCLHGYVYSLDERALEFNRKYNGLTPFSLHRRASLLNKKDPYWDALNDPKLGEVIDQVGHGALWGYGAQSGVIEPGELSKLRPPSFLMQHGEIAFTPFYDFFETAGLNNMQIMRNMSQTMDAEIAEFVGMMRWVVTVLAMLNEVPTRSEHAQPSHMVRAGLTRRLPAFDYHRITLRLPKIKPVPYLERYLANVERKHRAHMVREHWRTYLSERPCPREEHTWEYDYENGYRLCAKCLSQSRLIHEHKRGDESLGWIHHEYTIKRRYE
jgi:hypothetical protein